MKAESYESLPRGAKLHHEKVADIRNNYMRTLTNTGYSHIKLVFKNWNVIEDYASLLTNVLKDKKTIKKVATVWEEDTEFGRQFLNGVHPTRIRRCDKLPAHFLVNDKTVGEFLDRGKSLSEEMKVY